MQHTCLVCAPAPGYDPFGPDGANLNLVIGNGAVDPISGSVPHRAYLADVRRLEEAAGASVDEVADATPGLG